MFATAVAVQAQKYKVSLRKLLQQGISESEFYGDFTEKEKLWGNLIFRNNSESLFKTIIKE